MAYENALPKQMPAPGYYYHYKHDPAGPVENYAYYIYGVGHHTEDDCRPEDSNLLNYRPLYDAFVYKNGKMLDNRPLGMFFKPQEWQGRAVERFTRITDEAVIKQLQAIRRKMYPEELADWGL
jgi:hypothetical protein